MISLLRTKVRKTRTLGTVALAGTVLFLAAAGPAHSDSKIPTPVKSSKAPTAAAGKEAPPAAAPISRLANDKAVKAINQMAFLSGNWEGKVNAFPFQMDIAIQGSMDDPGPGIAFKIHATPTSAAKMGIEGDYQSHVQYSDKHAMLRAVIVDLEGRGVEMIGRKVPNEPEWQFDSTPDGAPFPFKVRLIPINTDQILVNYTTGGRLPLKYEVTFNRVDS